MEDNEDIILNNCRLQVSHLGKQLNIFSIAAVLSVIAIAGGGLGLIYFSSLLDDAMQYYLDNIIGLAGIGLILLAALLVPAVVLSRRLVHMAKHIRMNNDVMAIPNFLHLNKSLWKYMTIVLIVTIVGIAISLVGGSIYLSLLHGGF